MPSILVVDDDPLIRDLLCEALPTQWKSVAVVTAAHGDEALRIVFAHETDVVLLDVALPGRSASRCCSRFGTSLTFPSSC